MNFHNKVALITGAAVGIGRATALGMAERGADLCLLDLDEAGLEALKAELSRFPVRVFCARCDVSREDGNIFVWATAAKDWSVGSTHHLRGTVKEQKDNINYLTRCMEVK